MTELTRENWHEFVFKKARSNHSAALMELIKDNREQLLSAWGRPKHKLDILDIYALSGLVFMGYLNSSYFDTLNGLDHDLRAELTEIYRLANAALEKIARLQVPDTGKLKDLCQYLP